MKKTYRAWIWLGAVVLVWPLSAQDNGDYEEDQGGQAVPAGESGGGRGEGRQRRGGGNAAWGNMSEEERSAWRERVRSMSPEERSALRERMRNLSPEDRERLRNASPDERANWARQGGSGGQSGGRGGRRGGRRGDSGEGGGGMSRRVDVPEEYRSLVDNSPFMSVEYRASLERSGGAGRREIQFTGLTRPGGVWLFGLEERRQNRTYWLSEGANENGIEILNFDETHKTLTVSLNGIEMVLRISSH